MKRKRECNRMDIKKTTLYSQVRRMYKEMQQKQDIGNIVALGDKEINISKEFHVIEKNIMKYIDEIEQNGRVGHFAGSSESESIYAYTYFVMIKGLLGIRIESENISSVLKECQLEDGYFYDNSHLNLRYIVGDGWGKRHFVPHVIIAFERLKIEPKYKFVFLEPFYDEQRMKCFMKSMDWNNAWTASNTVMNVAVCLQYARDFLDEPRACDAVKVIQEWLLENIREDSGMWYNKKITTIADKYEAIRCAYHLYPILIYDRIDIPYKEKAIDIILSVQNKYGGFDTRKNSSACEDIDAVASLIFLAKGTDGYRNKDVNRCLERAFYWIKQNQMEDGGFVFRRGEAFDYGCKNVQSNINESNLFATWFRLLSLCYIHDYLTGYKRNYSVIPGYEYPIFEVKNDKQK